MKRKHADDQAATGKTARFEGVFSLLLTPFKEDRQIDWDTYEAYVEWQLSFEPGGLFAVCGSSEMEHLGLEERLELAQRAVRLAGRSPVVATANLGTDPAKHPEEVRRMAETGVSGIVLVPPPGMGTDQQKLGAYFAALADVASCPAILYEWPVSKPYTIDADVYGELVRHHNVIGIKDTTSTIEGIRSKIKAGPESIVYQANHAFLPEAIRLGARGTMATSSAANADLLIAFWQRASRDTEEADDLLFDLVTLIGLLTGRGAYPLSAKYMARLQGMDLGMTSRSGLRLSQENAKTLDVWHTKWKGAYRNEQTVSR